MQSCCGSPSAAAGKQDWFFRKYNLKYFHPGALVPQTYLETTPRSFYHSFCKGWEVLKNGGVFQAADMTLIHMLTNLQAWRAVINSLDLMLGLGLGLRFWVLG